MHKVAESYLRRESRPWAYLQAVKDPRRKAGHLVYCNALGADPDDLREGPRPSDGSGAK